MKPNLYEHTAELYDFGNDREQIQNDIPFYVQTFNKFKSKRILEIGCGTGRVGIELYKKGFDIAGIDLSDQMLNVYRSKLEKEKIDQILLFNEDMCDFELNKLFDAIIFPFRVFQALRKENDRNRCLECVCKHLNPDGIAIISMFNPHPGILNEWGKKNIVDFDVDWIEAKCKIRRITNQLEHNARDQIINVEMIYQKYVKGNVVEEYSDLFELGYLYPGQAKRLFQSNGLIIVKKFGGYDFRALSANKYEEQIYI